MSKLRLKHIKLYGLANTYLNQVVVGERLKIARKVKNFFILINKLIIKFMILATVSLSSNADVIFVVDAPNSLDTVEGQKNGVQPYSGPQSQTFDLSTSGDTANFLSGSLEANTTLYYYEPDLVEQNFNDDYMGDMNQVGGTATWTVTGYPPNTAVDVYATWRNQFNYSTASPYVINGGATINIDHLTASAAADLVLNDPAGGTENFQLLGSTVADSNGQVQVVLTRGNAWTPVDALAFVSQFAGLKGATHTDNQGTFYLSTSDSTQGVLISSSSAWATQHDIAAMLMPKVDMYLHVDAKDSGGPAGFIGDFAITTDTHIFENGLSTLSTDDMHWRVTQTPWDNYQPATSHGANGVSPWGGNAANISAGAQWIWSADNNLDDQVYFTTKIAETFTCSVPELNAVGISIGSGGTDTRIDTLTEAEGIFNSWINAGSPETGLIDSGRYFVEQSGTKTVDRVDFGGQTRAKVGTLSYPGFGAVGTQNIEHFLVRTNGKVYLPPGNYSIYVESDDGFNLILDTLVGDAVVFNKYGGGAGQGAPNELRFEGRSGNTRTGGSFTINQASIFDLRTIFYEHGGGDYMEVMITNQITNSTNPANYEVFAHGALNGKLLFGQCELPPAPTNAYRLDETQYNDIAGEVIDSIGALNGTAVNTQPTAGKICNAADLSASGADDYIILDENLFNGKSDYSVSYWLKTSKTGAQAILSGAGSSSDNEFLHFFSNATGFALYHRAQLIGFSNASIATDTWQHFVITREGAQHCVYQNSVLIACNSLPEIVYNISSLFLGQEQDNIGGGLSSGQAFEGLIDELVVFDEVLTEENIAIIYNNQNNGLNIDGSSRSCPVPPPIDHFQIVHDGQGLTCEAESITINACINSYDGTCLYSNRPISLNINAIGSTSISQNVSFNRSTNVSIAYKQAETAVLSVSNPTEAALNPTVCVDGAGNSCNILFEDAGFRFINGATGLDTVIPNQVAGNDFVLRLQAVKNTNGVCTGLFSGARNIELAQQNVNPGGTDGLSFTMGGSDIAKYPNTTTTALNFDSDSIATLPASAYLDAGQIRLRANYDQDDITLVGASNTFWVSPAQLQIGAQLGATPINGDSVNAGITHKAGENFELTVTALNSFGNVTPNYSPGQIQISLARIGPTISGSVDGDLQVSASSSVASSVSPSFQNASLDAFVLGESSYSNAHYSEVGLITLDVQDSNYANQGIVIGAPAINIGRFVPDHFTQTVEENGLFSATCGFAVGFAAYSGQRSETNNAIGAISYLTQPVLAITARNKQGAITQNYYQDSEGSANDYMKLSAANIAAAISVSPFDQSANGLDGNPLPLVANIAEGSLSQNDLTVLPAVTALPRGVLHYQLRASDNFYYSRSPNAIVAPFTADIDLSVASFSDADGINASTTSNVQPTGLEIRFGRLVLENSFGPETENLAQTMHIEHFDGTTYTRARDDACAGYDATNVSLSNISLNPSLSAILGGAGRFTAGQTNAIELQAPGEGNKGQIGVEYDTVDWLLFDWDNDGAYDDNPRAVASFGIYRGNDRTLHWREVFD